LHQKRQEGALGLSFGSINTGLPKDIVQQIVNAEKIPIKKMEDRKVNFTAKKTLVEDAIKRVQDLKGLLAANANEKSLREMKVDTNKDLVNVAVDKNTATPGNYQFEVVQLAQKSSAISTGFEKKDDYTGVGFIRYMNPKGEEKEVYVDSDHASLEGIANLINSDPKSGMRASVINDSKDADAPWKLLLSLTETGALNKASFPYFYFVDGVKDFEFQSEREAQNAKIKLDGFEIEVPENKVKDLIPGVTIDLLKARPGEEFSIKIGEDIQAVATKVKDIVEKINNVLKFILEQNTMDEKTDTSKTLGGDSVLRSLESRLRGVVLQGVNTSAGARRLADLGVVFQKDGMLKLDDKRFEATLAQDYRAVSEVLIGAIDSDGIRSKGFIENLTVMTDQVLRAPDGLLASRKKGFQSNIDQIDKRIEDRQRMIEQKERTLKDKFARLEGTISKIKGQGAGLAGLSGGAGEAGPQLG